MTNNVSKITNFLNNNQYKDKFITQKINYTRTNNINISSDNIVNEVIDIDINENTDLNTDKNLKVNNEYISMNTDLNLYNKKLDEFLSKYSGTRNKTVAAAIFLATQFPKIPYFWGGGHDYDIEDFKGINYTWGKPSKIVYGGDEIDNPIGSEHSNSLDCSGFITWCLVNGGYDVDECLNTTSCYTLGEKMKITDENIFDFVKVGDLGYRDGHVGMVISTDKENNTITFAHVSGKGYGMNITTIDTKTGKIVDDDVGALPYLKSVDRIGKEDYFTTIISVPYEN